MPWRTWRTKRHEDDAGGGAGRAGEGDGMRDGMAARIRTASAEEIIWEAMRIYDVPFLSVPLRCSTEERWLTSAIAAMARASGQPEAEVRQRLRRIDNAPFQRLLERVAE
ncbi:MAG: hypothetical protein IT337_16900 [Thermomicrobiales bacterium]|nr:hypothetical protein [Thermomicrobiales bacterium]